MTPNKSIKFIDAATGKVVGVDEFYDPALRWIKVPTDVVSVVAGKIVHVEGPLAWVLDGWYEGEVLPSWFVANPRPE